MKWENPKAAAKRIGVETSGVYLISEVGIIGTIVYIGESHTGQLRKTMLRHFQKWKGQTAGPTYSPENHRVAFIKTTAANAVQSQNNLINEVRPRDNAEGKPEWWEFWK